MTFRYGRSIRIRWAVTGSLVAFATGLPAQEIASPSEPPAQAVEPPPSGTSPPSPSSAFERWLQSSPFAFLFVDRRRPITRSYRRLASTPPMFGDSFPGAAVVSNEETFLTAALPLAGGSRRAKVAEHNKAYPVDRLFFYHQHFHHAVNVQRSFGPGGPLVSIDPSSVDRYTIGLEKTFPCACWSTELRLPLTSRYEYGAPDYEVRGGDVGNLSVITKGLVYETPFLAAVAGLGVDAPTGSNVHGRLPFRNVSFVMHNQSVHLAPYLGFLSTPTDNVFYQGFAQLDVPLNGNRVDVADAGLGVVDSAVFTEQTLVYLDLAAGYWLYRQPRGERFQGLASLLEFHYTTALQDGDMVTFLGGSPAFVSPGNRVDVVDLTVGLHAQFAGQTQLRIGGAFPINAGDDRFYDAEVTAAIIQQF